MIGGFQSVTRQAGCVVNQCKELKMGFRFLACPMPNVIQMEILLQVGVKAFYCAAPLCVFLLKMRRSGPSSNFEKMAVNRWVGSISNNSGILNRLSYLIIGIECFPSCLCVVVMTTIIQDLWRCSIFLPLHTLCYKGSEL